MKIAFASGKGGTGKTFLTTNLAVVLSENAHQVTVIDCDVEEPNCHIFLKSETTDKKDITVNIPVIDNHLCTGCRLCSSHCQFNALITVKEKTYVFEEMCHSCGLCSKICPVNAISEKNKKVGDLSLGHSGKVSFIEGKTVIGTELSASVVADVKQAWDGRGLALIDSPPGTSCQVVETVRDCDFVVLVTEPSPFGLNDLKLAVEMVRKLDIPFGVAINRCTGPTSIVHEYCQTEHIPIVFEMPLDRDIAESYSTGDLIVNSISAYRYRFIALFEDIKKELAV